MNNDRQPNRQSDSSEQDDNQERAARPDRVGEVSGQNMPGARQQPGSQGISNRPDDADPDDAEDTDEAGSGP